MLQSVGQREVNNGGSWYNCSFCTLLSTCTLWSCDHSQSMRNRVTCWTCFRLNSWRILHSLLLFGLLNKHSIKVAPYGCLRESHVEYSWLKSKQAVRVVFTKVLWSYTQQKRQFCIIIVVVSKFKECVS